MKRFSLFLIFLQEAFRSRHPKSFWLYSDFLINTNFSSSDILCPVFCWFRLKLINFNFSTDKAFLGWVTSYDGVESGVHKTSQVYGMFCNIYMFCIEFQYESLKRYWTISFVSKTLWDRPPWALIPVFWHGDNQTKKKDAFPWFHFVSLFVNDKLKRKNEKCIFLCARGDVRRGREGIRWGNEKCKQSKVLN